MTISSPDFAQGQAIPAKFADKGGNRSPQLLVGSVLLDEGQVPRGAVQGKNSFGNARYDGPAPPSGTHRYFFHVFALDTKLSLAEGASRGELEAAMKGHIVGSAEFYGTYSADP